MTCDQTNRMDQETRYHSSIKHCTTEEDRGYTSSRGLIDNQRVDDLSISSPKQPPAPWRRPAIIEHKPRSPHLFKQVSTGRMQTGGDVAATSCPDRAQGCVASTSSTGLCDERVWPLPSTRSLSIHPVPFCSAQGSVSVTSFSIRSSC